MKHINLKFTVVLTILLAFTTSALAQGGTTGPLTWNLSGGTLTISGNGAMPDYECVPCAPWHQYWNDINTVIIQNGVTSIGTAAFYGFPNLTSITIGNSVTTIGMTAFMACGGLTSIIIPNSVITIGGGAFKSCSNLSSVALSNNLTTIEGSAFANCGKLSSITLPNSVKTIGDMAFFLCTNLTSIDIPNSVTTIGEDVFAGCSKLNTVTIGSGVITIGDKAFNSCTGLKTVNYNAINCTKMGNPNDYNYVFTGCTALETLNIGEQVINIPDHAFRGCGSYGDGCTSLSSVTIGGNVKTIGNRAFSGCSGLTSIIIPNSVTMIGDYAFSSCSGLTSIIIPNSVITIGEGAFSYCSGLASASVGVNVTKIGDDAFTYCWSLTSIAFPNSLTSIGNNVFFNCGGLISVAFPNDLKTIGNRAFSGCSGLKSITAQSQTPPTLGTDVFNDVSKSTPVTIPCLAYSKYSTASGWKDFTEWVVDGPATEYAYTAKCYFPYSDENFKNLNKADAYYKYLTNSVGCDSIICLTLKENIAPQMCMISVDESNHNRIVWKKWEEDVAYNIYREGAQGGQYDLVGTVEPNGANSWVDLESNAKIRSYRYKVAGVDFHGIESTQSAAHKTMHLTINAGQNNSWNLIWTAYEGTTYSTYNIYRATGDMIGEFSLIGTMPSGNTSFSDFGAPAEGYVYYMVEIMLNEDCSGGKAVSSIKSNVATNNPGGVGIVETWRAPSLQVYPNPTNGVLNLIQDQIDCGRDAINRVSTITGIEVYDVMGRMVTPLNPPEGGRLPSFGGVGGGNISHLPSGVYFLRIYTDEGVVVRKVVKE